MKEKKNKKNFKVSIWLYVIIRPLVTILFKILFWPKIIGKNNIPKSGGLILAGNHTAFWDPILSCSSTRRTIHFLVKEALHKGYQSLFFKGLGTIPVDRSIHDSDAYENAVEMLKKGKVIGIFPEATINRTNEPVIPFKTGAVRMARQTDCYLVPFTITGEFILFKRSVTIEFYEKRKIMSDDIVLENEKFMDFISQELIKKGKGSKSNEER